MSNYEKKPCPICRKLKYYDGICMQCKAKQERVRNVKSSVHFISKHNMNKTKGRAAGAFPFMLC
jgi:hypothetical protein